MNLKEVMIKLAAIVVIIILILSVFVAILYNI